jgi:hypothetical protein
MPAPVNITGGTDVTFPVSIDHPLAPSQSFRTPTVDDITSHPVYSGILDVRVAQALASYPPAERTAELRASLTNSIAAQLASMIGHIIVQQVDNITVASGQTLTYNGNWSEVSAGNVQIQSGGVIRVVGTDPTLSATLVLKCNSFGAD